MFSCFFLAKMLAGLKGFKKAFNSNITKKVVGVKNQVVNLGDHPTHIHHQDYNIYPGIIVVLVIGGRDYILP